MKLQIISNLFSPDELAGASLFTDLAVYLRDAGHDVRVTTTFSYYPAWKLKSEDEGIRIREEEFQGIPVRRISMHVPQRPTGKGRMWSDLSFFWSLLRHGRFDNWRPDAVLTALPMLSQCLAQRFLYGFRGIPRLIIVQDFVVEAALELGILKIPGAAGVLHAIQRWALRSAKTLTTISPVMLEKLKFQIGSDRRLMLIPNWIHQSLQVEIDKQVANEIPRKSLRLFYAGNLGVKQGLPDFLTQFKSARIPDIGWHVDIFGGGGEVAKIKEAAADIPGVCLGSVLDEPRYVSSLLSTSACLVTQRPGIGANFLPSKLLPALATATPVLAVCDLSSPLAAEVIEGGFGEVVEPGNQEALKSCLVRWKQQPEILLRMSENAKIRAKKYHRDSVLPLYEEELHRLVSVNAGGAASLNDASAASRN